MGPPTVPRAHLAELRSRSGIHQASSMSVLQVTSHTTLTYSPTQGTAWEAYVCFFQVKTGTDDTLQAHTGFPWWRSCWTTFSSDLHP